MNPLHELAARVGLQATGPFGFALAGGYAVQAHGFLERASEDVDLFTVMADQARFPEAVQAAVLAYQAVGLAVEVPLQNDGFARLQLTNQNGATVKVELGVDWRRYPPVTLDIGPVLHSDDAVANKLAALYGRAEVRDYVDVGAVLRSGRYRRDELLRLAVDVDPGLDVAMFAQALRAVDRLPDSAFEAHGLSGDRIGELRELFTRWADEVDHHR
jgi:hypothetical protein